MFCIGGSPALAMQQVDSREFAPDVLVDDSGFGLAVAIDGDWIAISDPGRDGPSAEAEGAVHMFKWSESGWQPYQTIFSPEPGRVYQFGLAIALEGDHLVVGTPFWGFESTGAGPFYRSGKVFTYELVGSVWTYRSTLRPTTPSVDSGDFHGVQFGETLALESDRLAVGAPGHTLQDPSVYPSGAVHIYEHSPSGWEYGASISGPASPYPGSQNPFGSFGKGIALQGDELIVGAPSPSGMAFAYSLESTGWEMQHAFFSPFDGVNSDELFGWSISMNGSRLAIGAPSSDGFGAPAVVQLFEKLGGSWNSTQLLNIEVAEPVGNTSKFGASLKLAGDRLVVGAHGAKRQNQQSGYVYLYEFVPGTGFEQKRQYHHSNWEDRLLNSGLGWAVDVDEATGRIVAGNHRIDYAASGAPLGYARGMAYMFDIELGTALVCGGSVNSTGSASHLSVQGSLNTIDNRLYLRGSHLPPGEFALFLYGQSAGPWALPSGGDLCLVGGIQRLMPPGAIGAFGERELQVDLTAPREANLLMSGTTWGFQVWHRDHSGTQSITCTSNAVEVVMD